MTVVLPAPVASLRASRERPGLEAVLASSRYWRISAAGLPSWGADFGEPDGGFDGFDLAEEGADAAELVAAPVLEEAGGFG